MKNQTENRTWRYLVGRSAAILLGLIFLLAAFSKFGDLGEFQKALAMDYFIPLWLRGGAVLLIPGIELSIGVCLIVGGYGREAALIAAFLLFGFAGLGIYGDVTSNAHSCPCFKIHLPAWFDINVGRWVMARNLILIMFAFVSFTWNKKTTQSLEHNS